MNLKYKPAALPGVTFKVDVFNVFNRQVAESIEERYNSGTGLRSTYGTVLSYSSPRYVKLGIAYDLKH